MTETTAEEREVWGKLAAAATPGEWEWVPEMGGVYAADKPIITVVHWQAEAGKTLGAYIAAMNPANVARLLADAGRLEALEVAWKHVPDEWKRQATLRAERGALEGER